MIQFSVSNKIFSIIWSGALCNESWLTAPGSPSQCEGQRRIFSVLMVLLIRYRKHVFYRIALLSEKSVHHPVYFFVCLFYMQPLIASGTDVSVGIWFLRGETLLQAKTPLVVGGTWTQYKKHISMFLYLVWRICTEDWDRCNIGDPSLKLGLLPTTRFSNKWTTQFNRSPPPNQKC